MADRRSTKEDHFPERRKSDRRTARRRPAIFEVRYGVGKEFYPGYGIEIGEGGLAFTGDRIYPPGSEIAVRYRLNPEQEWVRVKASVRHVDQNVVLGSEFLNLHMGDRLFIVDFIDGRV